MEDNDIVQSSSDKTKFEPIKQTNMIFSKMEAIFAFVMLIIGFCFVRFVFWNVTGVFTTMFFIVTSLSCLFYLKKSKCEFYKNHMLEFTIILVFSLVFSITANGFIKFLDVLFVVMLGVYWIYSVGKQNKKIGQFFLFELFEAMCIIPFSSFYNAPKAISASTKKSKFSNNIKLILLGLLLTVPLTMVVALLLISADSGIEKMMHSMFNTVFEDVFVVLLQFVIGIPVGFYIFGLLYSSVNKHNKRMLTDQQCEAGLEKLKISPNMVMYSAVTPVCFLYILFFVSQLQYFLSAFNSVLPEGYSYADYARRGFFELFVISIINLGILICINFLSKQTGEHKPAMLKIYSTAISIFTILMIATALSKMLMYISNYGLTQLRIYVSWFMVLLAILFVLIIIKQFKFKFRFVTYAVIVFIVSFGVLCFSNIDGNIAKYNIKMYNEGLLEDLDVTALSSLSDDALIYVVESEIDTKDYLKHKLESYQNNPYFTYNLSSYKLKKLLERR